MHPRKWSNLDILFYQVDEPFEFNQYVSAVALPAQLQETPAGTVASVAGWGSKWEGALLSSKLMAVQVKKILVFHHFYLWLSNRLTSLPQPITTRVIQKYSALQDIRS